jgi:hypothetical protein
MIDRGEALVLNLGNNCFYGLNESATFIFQRLNSGNSIVELEREYAQRYSISDAEAHVDIIRIRDALSARSLLSRRES